MTRPVQPTFPRPADIARATRDKIAMARIVAEVLQATRRYVTRHQITNPRIIDGTVHDDILRFVDRAGQKSVTITSPATDDKAPAWLIVNDTHHEDEARSLAKTLAHEFSAAELARILGLAARFWTAYARDVADASSTEISTAARSLARALRER